MIAERRAPSAQRRTVLVVAACAVVALVLAVVWRPAPTRLPAATIGDASLGQLGRQVIGDDRPGLAVACVTPGSIRTVVMGAGPTDRFEIGSMSKGLTGLLLADMIERNEVRADTRAGTLLPVTGSLADVTLSQLATHTSGLPTQLPTLTERAQLLGEPDRRQSLRRHGAAATGGLREVRLDAPPGTYSNLGFELLGAALASAADRPYRDLLRERILIPAGLTGHGPVRRRRAHRDDLLGQMGRTADAWLGEAWLRPVGCVPTSVRWPC